MTFVSHNLIMIDRSMENVNVSCTDCQIRVKSGLILTDLKFKSGLIKKDVLIISLLRRHITCLSICISHFIVIKSLLSQRLNVKSL